MMVTSYLIWRFLPNNIFDPLLLSMVSMVTKSVSIMITMQLVGAVRSAVQCLFLTHVAMLLYIAAWQHAIYSSGTKR